MISTKYLCSCKNKECFCGTMFIKYMIIKHTVYIHWKYMSWNNDIIIWNTKLIKIYTNTQYKTDLNVCVEINHSSFLNPGFQLKSWKSSLQYHNLHLCAVNLNEHWSMNAIPDPGMGAHTHEMTGHLIHYRTKWPQFWQTTISNAFSWMKMIKFRFEFHWNLFPWVQLTISQHWFR